jgi:hypothetical protein
MIILLAVLFILGNLLVALGIVPSVTLLALAIVNLVCWGIIIVIAVAGFEPLWPWHRS